MNGYGNWLSRFRKAGFPVALADTNYRNIAQAQMAGLNATCISILSEEFDEEADLAGIGRLVAMTPNDEVNALAAHEFSHFFGRANVYQVPPRDGGSGNRVSLGDRHLGRTLFDEDLHYGKLSRMLNRDWSVKTTNLTDTFSFSDFSKQHGDHVVPLFLVDDQSNLHVVTTEFDIESFQQPTILALVKIESDEG